MRPWSPEGKRDLMGNAVFLILPNFGMGGDPNPFVGQTLHKGEVHYSSENHRFT